MQMNTESMKLEARLPESLFMLLARLTLAVGAGGVMISELRYQPSSTYILEECIELTRDTDCLRLLRWQRRGLHRSRRRHVGSGSHHLPPPDTYMTINDPIAGSASTRFYGLVTPQRP
jgi:hypothetical protein